MWLIIIRIYTLWFFFSDNLLALEKNLIFEKIKDEDLMVPAERVEEAQREAEHLPFVELNKVDLQWLQVNFELILAILAKLIKNFENTYFFKM